MPLPEANNELAFETLLPGFGHDLSLQLGEFLEVSDFQAESWLS